MLSALVLLRNFQIPGPLILLHHRQTPSFISDPITNKSNHIKHTEHTIRTVYLPDHLIISLQSIPRMYYLSFLWRARSRQNRLYHIRERTTHTPSNPACEDSPLTDGERKRKGKADSLFLSSHFIALFASKNTALKRC